MRRDVKHASVRLETRRMAERWSDSRLLSEIIHELRRIEGSDDLTMKREHVIRRARYARELSQLLSMRGEQLELFPRSPGERPRVVKQSD